MKKILFAGCGRMGTPMIKNMSKTGLYDIYAYDVNKENLDSVVQQVR